MIIFITLRILALDCCSTFILFADEALVFKSSFFYILNPFYIDHSIFLFKIALRNPNSADIMHPHIVTDWYFSRICWLYEIIIVTFLFFFTFFSHNLNNIILVLLLSFYLLSGYIFLFLLAVWTLLWVLIIAWIGFLEEIDIDVDGSSFHCSSFDIAKRAWKIDACCYAGSDKRRLA